MTHVVMPQMGESLAEGTVVRWLKKPGDRVERDEALFEISTDKVDTDVPSPTAGILDAILVREGETVAVGAPVATIRDDQAAARTAGQPSSGEPAAEAAVANPADVAPKPRAPGTSARRTRRSSCRFGGRLPQAGRRTRRTRARAATVRPCSPPRARATCRSSR